jgi:hypothetical protein
MIAATILSVLQLTGIGTRAELVAVSFLEKSGLLLPLALPEHGAN